MRTPGKPADTFVVPLPIDEAQRRVQAGAIGCYQRHVQIFYDAPGADVTVESEVIDSRHASTRVGAGNAINYVPYFQVDLAFNEAGTDISVLYEHEAVRKDRKYLSDVSAWLRGDTQSCSVRARGR